MSSIERGSLGRVRCPQIERGHVSSNREVSRVLNREGVMCLLWEVSRVLNREGSRVLSRRGHVSSLGGSRSSLGGGLRVLK